MTGLVALLLVAGATALWFRRAMQLRLPRNRAGFVAAWAAGALLGVAALLSAAGWIEGAAAVLALLGGSFLLFTVSISAQKLGDDAIRVGDPLPDATAKDEQGEDFPLSRLAGGPLLLKFFRGHW